MTKKSDTIFVVLVYKYDDKAKKFVGADDLDLRGMPYYCVLTDPDVVLEKAKRMIFLELIQEYAKMEHVSVSVMGDIREAVKSVGAQLVRLPHGVADVDSNVGFLIGRFDVPEGDQDNFAYVRALVVKVNDDNDDNMIKWQDGHYVYPSSRARVLQEALLPAVNNPIEI